MLNVDALVCFRNASTELFRAFSSKQHFRGQTLEKSRHWDSISGNWLVCLGPQKAEIDYDVAEEASRCQEFSQESCSWHESEGK